MNKANFPHFNMLVFNKMCSNIRLIYFPYNTCEPRHEKTCFCHMRTTKAQISLPLLFAA